MVQVLVPYYCAASMWPASNVLFFIHGTHCMKINVSKFIKFIKEAFKQAMFLNKHHITLLQQISHILEFTRLKMLAVVCCNWEILTILSDLHCICYHIICVPQLFFPSLTAGYENFSGSTCLTIPHVVVMFYYLALGTILCVI